MLDALTIVVVGMAIVFLVLGVLWGVMVLFNRWFKPEAEEEP